MDTFLMICMVAADFGPYKGETFRITPNKIGVFVQAPVWIKKTLMFQWLLEDGSIKIGLDKKEQKKLENDPMEGISAEGKAEEITEADEAAEEAAEEAPDTVEEEESAEPVAVKVADNKKKTARTSKKGESK